jgi:hypothetical protein
MTPIETSKLILLCTIAGLAVSGAVSVEVVMICHIPVEPVILQAVIQMVSVTAGGLLALINLRRTPEKNP